MASTSARLLQLLELLQSRRTWTGRELAVRLGVTTRTVRANIAQLRDLGYPVDATPGIDGGYVLGPGQRVAPLLLEDDEAVAIAVSLRSAANTGVSGIEEAALRALAKLGQVLPPKLADKVDALQATIAPLQWGQSRSQVPAAALAVLAQACRDGVHVRFDYLDAKGAATQRTVEPHALVPDGRRWYLVAFDLDRDDWRTFRVDRTERARTARRSFRHRTIPGGNAASFVQERIRNSRPKQQVEVDFDASVDEVTAAFGHPLDDLMRRDAGGCRLRMDVPNLTWFAARLAALGVDFRVVGPPELQDHLETMAARLTRATMNKDVL